MKSQLIVAEVQKTKKEHELQRHAKRDKKEKESKKKYEDGIKSRAKKSARDIIQNITKGR